MTTTADAETATPRPPRGGQGFATRSVVLIYVVIAGLWIALSDRIALIVAPDPASTLRAWSGSTGRNGP